MQNFGMISQLGLTPRPIWHSWYFWKMLPYPLSNQIDFRPTPHLVYKIEIVTFLFSTPPPLWHCPNILHFILVMPPLIMGSLYEVNAHPTPNWLFSWVILIILFPHFSFLGKMVNSSTTPQHFNISVKWFWKMKIFNYVARYP